MISNFERFHKIQKKKQILKVRAFYFMWTQEICQDPPTCDLVLLIYDIGSK